MPKLDVPSCDMEAVRELMKKRKAARDAGLETEQLEASYYKTLMSPKCLWVTGTRHGIDMICGEPTDESVCPQKYCTRHWSLCID